MRKGFNFIVFLLVMAICVPGAALANEPIQFKDLSGAHWAKNEIDGMVRLGIIQGYPDRTFKPEQSVTREEFAKLLTSAFDLDLPPKKQKASFIDVDQARWSFPFIEAAKDFLTGYTSPSGKTFFDPTGEATREDVAVALVKTLGYGPDDLQKKDQLKSFKDRDEVSPHLETYVALAVEKKLITGYTDGYFRPDQPVKRSEAATLLYRAIKGAATDSQQQLVLNVNVPEYITSPSFYITGNTNSHAKVYINNKEVEVKNGSFSVGYRLEKEGTYTYTISARTSGGKTTSITKKVTYSKGAPIIEVTGFPESTNVQKIKVSWSVKNTNESYSIIRLNGERQTSSSKTIELKEGLNVFVITAENNAGKVIEVVKNVVFKPDPPELKVSSIPSRTDNDRLKVSWTVKDVNDARPEVYVNGEKQSGTSTTVQLSKGTNTITLMASNKLGRVTVQTYTVVLDTEGPILYVNPIPSTTNQQQLDVIWTATDVNDSNVSVTVNGKYVYGNKTTLTLSPGKNTIHIKATNNRGVSAEKSYTIEFVPPAPKLTLGYIPNSTTSESITLTWNVEDANDTNPLVYVNNQVIHSNNLRVTLVRGKNEFKFVASNKFGKTTEITRTVTYNP